MGGHESSSSGVAGDGQGGSLPVSAILDVAQLCFKTPAQEAATPTACLQ